MSENEKKDKTARDIIEEVCEEICDHYCKYPDIWNAEKDAEKDEEMIATICIDCPLKKL